MIEYLEQLVKDEEYQKVIALAERLLLNSENTSWDLMVIYSRLTQARNEIGEYYGAQVAGQLATKMARDLEAWDYFGISSMSLGLAYDRLAQYEEALATWYEYISQLPYYREEATELHPVVLYNIGVVQGRLGRTEESLRTIRRANDVAVALGHKRTAHGIRHGLIDAHLRYGSLQEIPSLLAQCAHYLRHNSGVTEHNQSRLWHIVLRVRFALTTKRYHRAMRVATRGLSQAEGVSVVQYHLYYLLAQVHDLMGEFRTALDYSIRARSKAMDARRYDLEFAVTNYVYGLLTSHPELNGSPEVPHSGYPDGEE